MTFADLILIYTRAIVYLLVVGALFLSPSATDIFRPSQLSTAIAVSTIYVPIAVCLERKRITKTSPRVNKFLYVLDMVLLSWVVGSSGGIASPIYPFLFLPVIFIAVDHGTKDALIFSVYASLVGSAALLMSPPPKFHYFLTYIATIFTIALSTGALCDSQKFMENREKTLSALRALAIQRMPYQQTIPRLLEILAKACGADAVVYLLYDEEGEKLVFQSITYGLRGEEEERRLLEREIPIAEGGLSVEVFQKGEPILVKDAKTYPNILKDVVEKFEVGSVMSFPLTINSIKRGVFHFIRRWGSKPFTEREFQEMKDFVAEGMIVLEVIEKGRLVEKRKDYLEVLSRLISNLSTAINIEEVGRTLINSLREIIPSINDLVLAKCTSEECTPVFHFGEGEIDFSLLRRVYEEVRKSGRVAFIEGELDSNQTSAIGVPIFEGGNLTHILVLFTLSLLPPNDDTLSILSAIGYEIGNILARVYSIAELERYAFHDQLTKLLNRRMFYQRIGRDIKGARRYGYPIALAIMDIDNFKEFNDTYGHLEGDRLLAELGRLLREEIRASDYAARLGGEEFAIVLPHTSKEAAAIMAERIRKKIKESLGISVSFGIGEFPSDANTLRALLRKADQALYEAKKKGKGRIALVSSK
ncbi:GGDEF domain-containing protein [bacterium]|nr:GGDEF domain-containing protein [bacterium]